MITSTGYKELKTRAHTEGKHTIMGHVTLPCLLVSIELITLGFISHCLVRSICVPNVGRNYKTIEEALPHYVGLYQQYQKEYNELYGYEDIDDVATIVNDCYRTFSFSSMYQAMMFVANMVRSKDPVQNLMDYSPLNNNLRVVNDDYSPIEEVDND